MSRSVEAATHNHAIAINQNHDEWVITLSESAMNLEDSANLAHDMGQGSQ
jgi:hypothetical protein